jgi:hypothetical protein
MPPGRPIKFLRSVFWEFVQNLPLIAGFVWGLDLWQHHRPAGAMACMAAGSVIGSLAIWATEARIVHGHREPLRVVLTNIAVIALLMLVLTAYLSAPWSRWWLDVVLGAAAGLALGAAQDLAAGSPIGIRHCAALGLSFTLGLVGVRLLAVSLPPLWSILTITTAVTVIIAVMDYGPPLARESPEGLAK